MNQKKKIFRRVRSRRVSDTVADQIISLIEDGKLQIGDMLPSERELVRQLQLSRSSVREALRMLEFRGIIEVRPGAGGLVLMNPRAEAVAEQMICSWFQDQAKDEMDLIDLWGTLMRPVVRLTAEKCNPDLIREMDEARNQMIIVQVDSQRLRLENDFHRIIGLASRKLFLVKLVRILMKSLEQDRRALQGQSSWVERFLDFYTNLLEAFLERDADAAEYVVDGYFADMRAALLSINR